MPLSTTSPATVTSGTSLQPGMADEAEWYSFWSGDHQKESKWVLDMYWNRFDWSSQDNAIDIGCGTGDTTHNVLLPLIGPAKMVGTDLSRKRINFASRKWAPATNLSFVEMDISTTIEPLTYFDEDIQRAGGFDKMFSFFCLQWVKQRDLMAANMFKLLKPGGQGLVMLVVRSGVYNVWDRLANSPRWMPHLPPIDIPLNDYIYMNNYEEVFCRTLTNAGLTVLESKVEERVNAFTNDTNCDEELMLRLSTVDPLVSKLPTELKAMYLADLVRLVKRDVSPRGATDYTALLVLFKKNK